MKNNLVNKNFRQSETVSFHHLFAKIVLRKYEKDHFVAKLSLYSVVPLSGFDIYVERRELLLHFEQSSLMENNFPGN